MLQLSQRRKSRTIPSPDPFLSVFRAIPGDSCSSPQGLTSLRRIDQKGSRLLITGVYGATGFWLAGFLLVLSSLGDKRTVLYKGGFGERTLVPVFVPGEHANVPSFRFRSGGTSECLGRAIHGPIPV